MEVSDVWNDPNLGLTFSFNENGDFVSSDGNKAPKEFKTDNNFGSWLHAYIQKRLLERGLIISHVGGEEGAPIFHTPNAFKNPEKLLVICCGSGRVLAGGWSVSVAPKRGLSYCSVLPFIEDAQKRGMEVVILNPNHPGSKILSKRYPSECDMSRHAFAVYEDFIIPGNPHRVFIICHSAGGFLTLDSIQNWPEWAIEHVEAVAMTDAVEVTIETHEKFDLLQWCYDHCINWICTDSEINTECPPGPAAVHRSAGTLAHVESTGSAYPYIWDFFDQMGADKEISPPYNS